MMSAAFGQELPLAAYCLLRNCRHDQKIEIAVKSLWLRKFELGIRRYSAEAYSVSLLFFFFFVK